MSKTETETETEITPRQQLYRWLLSHGVAAVQITFDGSGDSGQVEEVTLFGCTGTEITVNLDAMFGEESAQQAIEGLAYDATESWDWVNNDGGYGTVWWLLCDPNLLDPSAPMAPLDLEVVFTPPNPLRELEELLDDNAKAGTIVVDMNIRETTSTQHVYTFDHDKAGTIVVDTNIREMTRTQHVYTFDHDYTAGVQV